MSTPIRVFHTAVFALAIAGAAMAAPYNVVYVTHTPSSMDQYTPFLEGIYGSGNVGVTVGSFTNAHNDAGQQAILEAADLIIIGRMTNSGDYDSTGEPEYWNALDVPILLHSAYLVRSSRLSWLEGDQGNYSSSSVNIIAPYDPLLHGVPQTGGTVTLYDGGAGTYQISNADGTGILGTILATAPDLDVAIARWSGDEALYWSGSDEGGPGNPRVFWGTPGSDDWLSVHLTADGRQLLTNVVTSLMPTPEPTTLTLTGIGLVALVRRRRRK